MNAKTAIAPAPDFDAIKGRQNAAWGSGNYARIGTTLQIVGETLAEAVNARPGSRVLDVAAGNGNATLAFARRWSQVTSTDYVDTLLDQGRARARAEGLDVSFELADAENLRYGDGSFDAVVSTFGVMFTPDQERAAGELLRVCRSGGRIGLANWTPDGFVGQLFKTLGGHVAPPAGVRPPSLWGTASWLNDVFGHGATAIAVSQRDFTFRYLSPDHFVAFFRDYYGPVHKAFLALQPDAQAALHADMIALIGRFNVATDGTMQVPASYLEVVIDRT